MSAVAPRLPGIGFEVPRARLEEALPRMDVAVFVGFASTGPVNVPVAVEDVRDFEAVFGAAPRLAWDRVRGRWVHAHLAGAVRAFFANGGERCWVVRVAGAGAHVNRFRVPGLRRVARVAHGGWEVFDAEAHARSPGSWSDGLRVATRLRATPLRIVEADRVPDRAREFDLTVVSAGVPVPGDLVRAHTPGGAQAIFLPVATVAHASGVGRYRMRVTDPLRMGWGEAADVDPSTAAMEEMAQLVRFDLRVRGPDGLNARLDDLGLVPGHERAWRALPEDAAAFAHAAFDRAERARRARVPLTGVDPRGEGPEVAYDVPWGMGEDFGDEAEAMEPPGTALERDGLAELSENLFLDEALRGISARDLMDAADAVRYRAARPRALAGIHATLGWNASPIIEEATLVAVPDAVHRPWARLEAPPPGNGFSIVERSEAAPEAPSFEPCARPPRTPPRWKRPPSGPDSGSFKLAWELDAGGGEPAAYVIEESSLPDFAVVDATLRATRTELTVHDRAPGARFYRVRLEADPGWSHTLRVAVPERREFELSEDGGMETALAVHRALLRMCAARGDLFAAIALPRELREDAAIAYARGLAAGEGGCASFGAVYHPWVVASDAAGAFDEIPPDGPAAGLLARRALARGAWVAPANEPLHGIVALSPPLAPPRRLELQEARVNVVRREPAAFTLLAADTLAAEPELRPIQVRRLLSLLRRRLLEVGNEFAFEPHDAALRAEVERRLERTLAVLWRAGAFAGARPEDAFQVSAGVDVNPPGQVELGRLLVEVRVRPAPALRFITVRLVQAGASGVVTEVT